MSDEPSPEVRELAAKLFAAARAEQPGPALGRRLLLLEPPRVGQGVASSRAEAASRRAPAVVPARSRFFIGLAAAALLASGAGLWLVSGHDARPLSISPERTPGRPPSLSREPSTELSAMPSAVPPGEAPRAASETAPRVDTGERVAPSRPAPPRSRAAPRRKVVQPSSGPASSAGTSSAPPASAKPMTLLGELELLKRARSALRSGDGGQALELLDRHARERTSNGLDAEANLLRIEALAALGRHGDASVLAARFVRDNPNNALGDRAKSFIRAAAPGTP